MLILQLKQLQPYYLVISVFLLSTINQLFAPESIELLRYQSNSVSNGEWWRIITANFSHSSWNHWFLNMLGLIIIDYLYQPLVSQKERAYLLAFCIVINTLLIHWILNLYWYVGLSGALHGFLLGGAVLCFKRAKMLALAVFAIVTIKLSLELNFEINQTTVDFIGSNVVEEAHLFGALSALIFCSLRFGYWMVVKKS